MKKTSFNAIAVTVLSILSANVFAKALWCNYSDYFHLSENALSTLRISTLSGDNNVVVQQKDAVSFFIKDTPTCPPNGGYAQVTYSLDSQHFCKLTIHDGESEYHPEAVADCQGLAFGGMTYDGFGTYKYSLHFSRTK